MRHTVGLSILISLAIFFNCSKEQRLKDAALSDVHAGRFDAAIKKYQTILEIDNDSPLNLNNFGWIYLKNDNLEDAKKFLIRALSLTSKPQLRSMIKVNLRLTTAFQNCRDLIEKKQYQSALDTLLAINRAYQTNEMGYKYLALCYEGLEQPKQARANWEEIIEIYVNTDVRNHFYLLAKAKMIDIAHERIHEGDYEDAIDIFHLLLTVEPDSAATLNSLGWVLFRNEEWKKAKKILEKARGKALSKVVEDSIETNHFMVMTFLAGEYSLRKKNFKSALIEFEKVTKRYGLTDMSLKYLGLCYEELEKPDLARQCWQKIIEMYEGLDFKNVYKESEYENKYYELAMEKLKE